MKKIFLSTIIFLFFFSGALPALAAGFDDDPILGGLNYATIAGWGTQDLRVSIARTIRIILGFLGIIAVVIVIWAGLRWMTAGGNEDKVTKAKGILTAGLIGLFIILAAYAIATFVSYTLLDIISQRP